MELLNSLTNYFNQLGDQVYQILVNVQQTFDEMQMFFQIAQAYIIISGIALLIIFVIQIATINGVSEIKKELSRIRIDMGLDEQPEKPEEELHTIG